MCTGEKQTDVSVIIPIYNQESQILQGIKGLMREQTAFCRIEILLINDGSTDKSGEICQRLADKHPQIRYFEQSNQGVSAARNRGIRNARGKYLFYMDADDRLEPGTLSKVKNFFDTVEQETDLVTYRIDTIYGGKRLEPHFRYKYLQNSGIYDMKEYAYIGQTTMNIAVKNRFADNILFDENQTFSEDQKYCCHILRNTLKMGYCAEGRYIYYRCPDSASGRLAGACYVFEQCMAMFEEIFSWYEKEVPATFQGLYINDFYWKLCCHMLYPHHYPKEEYEKAEGRLLALLRRCSNEIILEHPNIDFFEKYYMLRLKGPDTISWRIRPDGFGLFHHNICTVWENSVEVVMTRCTIRGGRVVVEGFLKTVFFQFYEKEPLLCAIENAGERTRKVSLRSSVHNYYLSHEKTQRFWAFAYECEPGQVRQVRFEMGIGDRWFPVHYYFMPCVPFSHKYHRYKYFSQGVKLEMDKEGTIRIQEIPEKPRRSLWLYYDCAGVACDNGMLQFLHDCKQKDGVERYYIVSDVRQWEILPDRKRGVLWGSRKHRRLFRKCDRILTAYIEESNIIPYSQDQYDRYAGNFRWEVVYVQHGVLHIDMPWKYSPERMLADRVVVSTEQEARLYEKNGFRSRDLIRCRMPRLAVRPRQEGGRSRQRILYAPSWRSYLVGAYGPDHRWERIDRKFITSDYYLKIRRLLYDKSLQQLLRQYDMELDLKLHPIFEIYREYFEDLPELIHLVSQAGEVEEYAAFITDFSSYLYDYLFAEIPVFLYLPDEREFRSGMNGYRNMGEEEYWDKVNTEPEGLIGQIRDYLEQGKYEGMRADFYESGEPTEEIYQRESKGNFEIKEKGDAGMISVVIPYSEDQTYLVRCINAIRRQTYKDVELLLIAEETDPKVIRQNNLEVVEIENGSGRRYAGIDEAIRRRAKGEYLYFCSITSVPSPDTLETLLKEYKADGYIWKYAKCYVEEKEGFKACEDMQASYYGKLYDLRLIQDENIKFCEKSPFAELQFVAEYAAHMKDMEALEEPYIYESKLQWNSMLYEAEGLNAADWKTLQEAFDRLNDEVSEQLQDILYKRLENLPVLSGELLEIIQTSGNNRRLRYIVARSASKSWWTEVQQHQNRAAFENIKACLAEYEEDEAYLELLLLSCGIRKEQYPYLKNQDLYTALYFMQESSELKGYAIEDKNIPKENISAQVQKIIPAEEFFERTQKELTGTELAEYTVSKYANGGLGLKTIFRSLAAWIKYKL